MKYNICSNSTAIINESRIYSKTLFSSIEIKITYVNFKSQTFSYLESIKQPVLLGFFKPNATITNNFINTTYNCTFGEFLNTTGNVSQPITIFFINDNTINELNKGIVSYDLFSSLSLFNFMPGSSGNSAKVISNTYMNLGDKIYTVDKIFVTFKLMGSDNQTLNSGNATAFIDVYSGIVLKWVINNTIPEGNYLTQNSINLIINSTNIPIEPSNSSLNIALIIELSIPIIGIAVLIAMNYIKKKRRPPRNYKYYNKNEEKTIDDSIVKTDPNTPASNPERFPNRYW
ncbi:MAG: hypothetical protein ACP5TO_07660 [Thermoplasmata archaeon]